MQDAKDGVLSYNQLKDFRSSLMANIRHAESQGALSASNRKVKELIGYVTKDLDALVARSGNPQALAKYKAANKYVRDNTGKKGGLNYIDKIEILVLGGTWSHYPVKYQEEFIRDLYYAANIYY